MRRMSDPSASLLVLQLFVVFSEAVLPFGSGHDEPRGSSPADAQVVSHTPAAPFLSYEYSHLNMICITRASNKSLGLFPEQPLAYLSTYTVYLAQQL
ncbi:hypothetical protein GGR56DRAFT_626077 [Xylariaceae sp. FL0804]|nr:hypothetical protein GGR56DRAFT_626077 [Xylariaceae sp. FL0804]